MRVARHDDVALGRRALGGDADQTAEQAAEPLAGATQVQPHVGDHLVVAAAARVHLATSRSDDLSQAALVGGVDVFVAIFHLERAGRPLGAHALQARADRRALLCGEHAGRLEGLAVGDAAVDVDVPHDAVDWQAVVEALHDRIGLAREAATPELGHLRWSCGAGTCWAWVGGNAGAAARLPG